LAKRGGFDGVEIVIGPFSGLSPHLESETRSRKDMIEANKPAKGVGRENAR